MLTASAPTKRKLLIITSGWCLLILVMFIVGRMSSAPEPFWSGLVAFLFLFVPSAAVWYFQFVGYSKQITSEELLAKGARDIEREQIEYVDRLRSIAGHAPVLATVLGGSGSTLKKDASTLISCRTDCLVFSDLSTRTDHVAKFDSIVNLEISGPGTEQTNAGMVGGGFGIEGALKGIIISSVINKLTSKSKTNTFLRMSTSTSETFFHSSTVEPDKLRMILSAAIVRIDGNRNTVKSSQADGLSQEISKLHQLLQSGVLSQAEFSAAKQRLLK